ncbi:MAG: hypothetical protein E6900_03755, partial [Gemella haemolysans]|nr:hypothetical protein [Gemella haemolysans]
SKEDKDGYKLVKIESKNGGKFNEDGSEKEAAYIANTKQEVTYIYQRTEEQPTEEKGSFQEHHIYQTVDKDGKVITTDETKDKDVTKDGFKIRRVASEQEVVCLTSLDTADALLKVLESISFDILPL